MKPINVEIIERELDGTTYYALEVEYKFLFYRKKKIESILAMHKEVCRFGNKWHSCKYVVEKAKEKFILEKM